MAYQGPHKVSFTPYLIRFSGWHLLYQHTADLLCLDFCRPPTSLALSPVSTPLAVDAWEQALVSHPDQAYARYICDGLELGRYRRWRSALGGYDKSVMNLHLAELWPFPNRFTCSDGSSSDSLPGWGLAWPIPYWVRQTWAESCGRTQFWNHAICSMANTKVKEVAAIVAKHGTGALMVKVEPII